MSKHLLPGNATPFERTHSEVSARVLDTDVDAIRRARDPAATPEAFLPYLAAERSVHHYAGSLAHRRNATAESFNDHLEYGSPPALEAEIAADTGKTIKLREFFQDTSLDFPFFAVDVVIAPGETPPDLSPVWDSAIRRKNVRDMPRPRVRYDNGHGDLRYGAAAHFSVRIRPPQPPSNLKHGATARFLIQQRG